MSNSIYLDNASTSFPKPKDILTAMHKYLNEASISPFRRDSNSKGSSADEIAETRSLLSTFLGISNPDKISFTHNATYAINILLKGFLKPKDHVIISSFEHNSVIRPLCYLKEKYGIDWDVWPCDTKGNFSLENLERLIRPNTRLIFVSHASNVLGMLSPIKEISQIARKHNIALGVDCTQTAGHIDLETESWGIDMLAGTGHKCLLGPSGVGFLYVKDPDTVESFIQGGGGYNAISEKQPERSPSKYEAGTMNYLGILGLRKGMEWLKSKKQDVHKRQYHLLEILLKGLSDLDSATIYGTMDIRKKIPVVSFNIKNCFPSQVEEFLLKKNNIIVRSGLHCSPLIHKYTKTHPSGTVRVSLGPFNTTQDVNLLLQTLSEL